MFAFKYQGAVAFSSWAFILLGSPILISYGLILDQAPWYFYLVMPLLLIVAMVLLRDRWRVAAGWCLAAIFVASLIYSVVLTQTDHSVAYFSTGTRAWEFAAGSLLAYLGWRAPVGVRTGVSLLGMAIIGGCGFLMNGTLPFPGEPDRVCDTVAEFAHATEPRRRCLVDVEVQAEPDPDMLERLGEYAFRLRRELRYEPGAAGKYAVFGLVLNLTGPAPTGWGALGYEIRGLTAGQAYNLVVTTPNYPPFKTSTTLGLANSTTTVVAKAPPKPTGAVAQNQSVAKSVPPPTQSLSAPTASAPASPASGSSGKTSPAGTTGTVVVKPGNKPSPAIAKGEGNP